MFFLSRRDVELFESRFKIPSSGQELKKLRISLSGRVLAPLILEAIKFHLCKSAVSFY